MKKTAKPDPDILLGSWKMLNNVLTSIDDENFCQQLIDLELKGKRRGMFVFRIHSRFNRLRAARERREFMEICGHDAASKIASYPMLQE
jgi:hypothetical protein